MKILMLTPYLPYPLWSGGQIRTYNLLKNLSKKHKISLFSFIRNEGEIKYIPNLQEFCNDVKVFMKRPPWSLWSLGLSAVSVYPLVVCMYLKQSLKTEIRKAIERENFDLIHAETFYVMPNIPQGNVPTILVEQTIEYLVYQHFTQSVKFTPLKMLMNFDVEKIYFWEKRFWQKATKVVAMSDSDRLSMQRLVPNLQVDLVPNGVDTQYFKRKRQVISSKNPIILFVGNFKWLQNREAVGILVKKIWPLVEKELPNANLWIVGKFPTAEIKNFSSDSIKVSDDIDDIKDAYVQSDLLIAPIYGPGGTRYKILEAMATGLPVITTSTGVEGLDITHEKQALIKDKPEELASEIVKILKNPVLYKTLAENGRKLVEEKYNWERIARELDKIYERAVHAGKN